MPVARPRQRRNKSAGHSLECRGRGFLFFSVLTRRGGRGYEIGPWRAPLLASCSWLSWLLPYVLSHDPVVESGPLSFAQVGGGGSFTRLCPIRCAGACRRCADIVRHTSSRAAELVLGWVVAHDSEAFDDAVATTVHSLYSHSQVIHSSNFEMMPRKAGAFCSYRTQRL